MKNIVTSKYFLLFFIILLSYSLFPLGIESESISLAVRCGCLFVFLIFVGYRLFGIDKTEEHVVKGVNKTEKEIIKELAEYYTHKKEIDTQTDFRISIRSILSIVKAVFACDGSGIFMLKQSNSEITLLDYVSNTREHIDDFKYEIEESPFYENLKEKKSKIFSYEELNDLDFGYLKGGNINSLIAAPIIYHDEVIGIIFMDSDVKESFGDEDRALLESFGELLSRTLINYNVMTDLEMNAKLFSVFYEVSRHLNANLEYEEVFNLLLSVIQDVYDYNRISISLKEDEHKAKIYKVLGKEAGFPEGEIFDVNEGLNGWIIRKNKSILVSDLEKGDYFIPRYSYEEKNNYNMRSFLGAPISYGNACYGVVTVESETPNIFVEQHEKILSMLTNNIGSAMESTVITKKLKKLAVTDELTGLFNYRALKNRLYEEVERVKRYDSRFSLLMMDIDKFKNFNDSYGHLAGDQVLKVISGEFKRSLRNIDFIARYGGEEFVAILIETELDNAILSAERIRKNIETKAIEYKGKEYHITISIGVAEYNSSMTEEDIITIADKAMYKAKMEGRNKVIPYYV